MELKIMNELKVHTTQHGGNLRHSGSPL